MRLCISPLFVLVSLSAVASLSGVASSAAQEGERRLVPIQSLRIDELMRAHWDDHQLQPGEEATAGEWCRRVYLDIIGRIPTNDELQTFLADRRARRKANLVQRLLYSDQYTSEFARNWSTVWTNLLIGGGGGSDNNSPVNRAGMQKYLRDSFAHNKTFDQLATDLITATGANKPGTDNFNGAVNFLIGKLDDNATQATAATSRIFLGLQVQCTQCHNHPFNDWKQNQFWELNAFFRQAVALRRFESGSNMVDFVQLADQDFAGEGRTPREAEVYYEQRNATLSVAYPVFVTGAALSNRSGLVRDVNRRRELARLIVDSDYLPRAAVNRMWGYFLGYGFTSPVDDLGPHNEPSHPELLDFLASEFKNHSYDLKELIRWIVLSRPYSLSSKVTSLNESDNPSLGETPKFSHFYLRQMRAEQLYESLLVATRAAESSGGYEEQERLKGEWLQQFTVAFDNDEGQEVTTFDGTITQTLMLFNGPLINAAISDKPGGFLNSVATSSGSAENKVELLFVTALARRPSREERDRANALLGQRGDLLATLQDLWWALLNSNEFILNH